MKKLLFLLLVVAFFFQSCQKDDDTPIGAIEYIVFGHFFGECFGEECIEIFKIENDILYEDRKDNYPSFINPYVGEYDPLDDSLFQKVKDLELLFPEELLNETDIVIGSPDAGDWGGYYFEVVQDNVQYHFRIDKEKSNLPDYLKDFADILEDYILKAQG